jgi:hypothetical protein
MKIQISDTICVADPTQRVVNIVSRIIALVNPIEFSDYLDSLELDEAEDVSLSQNLERVFPF